MLNILTLISIRILLKISILIYIVTVGDNIKTRARPWSQNIVTLGGDAGLIEFPTVSEEVSP